MPLSILMQLWIITTSDNHMYEYGVQIFLDTYLVELQNYSN
jgi:hypothetical protein